MAKYVKGLNKDTAPIDQPEGSYRYAKNMLSNETAGAISNEPGTKVKGGLGSNSEIVIGSIETTEDTVILYTVDESAAGGVGQSNIYLYNPNATSNITALVLRTNNGAVIAGNDVDLKFNKKLYSHSVNSLWELVLFSQSEIR